MKPTKTRLIRTCISLCLLNCAGATQAIDSTRNLVKEWVAAEKAISGEAAEWQHKQALLSDLRALTRTEIETLQQSIHEIEASATVADATRAALVSEQAALRTERQRIAAFLAEVEPKLLAIRPSLPTPLAEKLTRSYQRIPNDPSDSALGIAERMQTVISLLTTINQFDRTITVHEELRTLDNGTTSEVETVYIGLGAAYSRTRSGKDAGFGQPGSDGWSWQSQATLAPAIRDVIDIAQNNTRDARFIALPVELQNNRRCTAQYA